MKFRLLLAELLSLLCITAAMATTPPVPPRTCRPMIKKEALSRAGKSLPANRTTVAQPKYVGELRQLVVLASFADRTFRNDIDTHEQWNAIFNEKGLSQSPFQGSVHDYFYDQSYGQFSLTFDMEQVTLSHPCSRYRSTSYDDERSLYLVYDIVDELQTRNIDWSPYDWDGDGYIDQLLIVYAGKGSSYGGFGGDSNSIWPHQWWLSLHFDPATAEPGKPRTVSSGGHDYLVDSYCAVQELSRQGTYGTFGTICHEYSHCFGLPDFYYGGTSVIHDWDIMDYGNTSNNGFCPPGYSAHERMLMGWLTPTELKEPAIITGMAALSDEPAAYIICNEGNPNEFYMVENRQPTGWDVSLPGSGIVVFHIDYDRKLWENIDGFPNMPNDKHYYIIPANNRTQTTYRQQWAYPYLSNDSLTNLSTPAATLRHANSDGTKYMSKPISRISVTDGLASFVFGDNTAMGIDEHANASKLKPELLYRMGAVSIVRSGNGTVRKVMKKNATNHIN